MRRAILLALAAAALVALLCFGASRRDASPPPARSPDLPPAVRPRPAPSSAPLPISTPPGSILPAVPTPAAAGSAPARDDLLESTFALAARRAGELFRRRLDPVGYLQAGEPPPPDLLTLSPEDRARLFALLDDADAGVRFKAAVALAAAALDPEELADLERRFAAEFAGLRDPNGSRMAFGLAYALAAHGNRTGVARIAEALRTGECAEVKDFRSGAALLVAITPAAEDAGVLRDLLRADPDRAVRKHSAIGLGVLGGDENRDALAQALLSEQDVEVRAWAALARGRTQQEAGPVDEALLRSIAEDLAGEVRGAAAFAVARTGGEETSAALIDLFRRDEHSMARLGAVAGLGATRAGEPATAEFLAAEGVPFLRSAAETDKSGLVRIYSVAGLSLLPAAEGRGDTFRTVAGRDADPWVRISAVQALARTEGAAAVPFLEERLAAEKHDWVRNEIQSQLSALRSAGAPSSDD